MCILTHFYEKNVYFYTFLFSLSLSGDLVCHLHRVWEFKIEKKRRERLSYGKKEKKRKEEKPKGKKKNI